MAEDTYKRLFLYDCVALIPRRINQGFCIGVRQWAQNSYSVNQRQEIATYELGHGVSIGHIPNDYYQEALMYKNQAIQDFEIRYFPLWADIRLVNQVYP